MSLSTHKPTGRHLLADFYDIPTAVLSDADVLQKLLIDAAHQAGARVLFSHFHGFGEGNGMTGVVLLAESHITIHTWPEEGFAAVDIFMCGETQPEIALKIIHASLAPSRFDVQMINRGNASV